jgi:hypothetical protein
MFQKCIKFPCCLNIYNEFPGAVYQSVFAPVNAGLEQVTEKHYSELHMEILGIFFSSLHGSFRFLHGVVCPALCHGTFYATHATNHRYGHQSMTETLAE